MRNETGKEALTVEGISAELLTKWAGRRIVCSSETGSTNDDARELADDGAAGGTLVVTEKQNKGRGRQGRVWESPFGGSIFMSCILRPDFSPDKASMLTIIAALSTAEAIEDICDSEVKAGIKWPNDIVMGGHKICGILTELHMNPDGSIKDVIIGEGINANIESFPENIAATAGSILLETGIRIDRNKLIACIMLHFEHNYEIFRSVLSLAPLKEEYEKRLLNMNKGVRVLDPAGEYEGTACGITEAGELIVETNEHCRRYINAGEVSVRGLYGYV